MICYEFLTGAQPFSGDTPADVFRAILDEKTPLSWPEDEEDISGRLTKLNFVTLRRRS